MSKEFFLKGIGVGDCIIVSDLPKIAPQPEPTSPRIKSLLSRGLLAPETLKPQEIREMTASVVYHLIMKPAGS